MKSARFETLVSKNPNNELFRFSLGQAYQEEENYEAAIEAFDFCLEKKPDWMMAAILKGKCLLSLQKPDGAKPVLESALQLAIDQRHETPEAELRKILQDLQ
ncbi:MAG: tetratricopeptide repeat protein [Verrucomicrobiota bacterium]